MINANDAHHREEREEAPSHNSKGIENQYDRQASGKINNTTA